MAHTESQESLFSMTVESYREALNNDSGCYVFVGDWGTWLMLTLGTAHCCVEMTGSGKRNPDLVAASDFSQVTHLPQHHFPSEQ